MYSEERKKETKISHFIRGGEKSAERGKEGSTPEYNSPKEERRD